MAFVLSTVEKLKWLISLFWHSSWLHDFSLVFKHLFPDAFTETNFPNALNEVGSFGLAGVVFALLSHLFFDGTHFEMLGLYLASHPDLMDCIIYEFFLAVTLDEPFFRRFVYMEVSLSHVPFVIVYLFTVMILGLCSFMIHLPLYLYWVFMTAIEYLVRAELIYIHVFARSLGLGDVARIRRISSISSLECLPFFCFGWCSSTRCRLDHQKVSGFNRCCPSCSFGLSSLDMEHTFEDITTDERTLHQIRKSHGITLILSKTSRPILHLRIPSYR
jgi:hypothetical protein